MFRDSRRVRQLLGLMILTSITLITVDYRGGANSPFRGLRRSAGNVFGPIERAVSSAVRPVGNALSALGNVGNADREVKRLRGELAAIEAQGRLNDTMKRQYDDAMRLLKLLNEGQYRSVAARVIAAAPSNFTYTVTINAGSDRGIRRDQTVVNASGLVGRVLEVSKFTSTVLLAIDLSSKVAGQLSYTGERGLVEGNGPNRMKFEVTPDATVQTGQAVVTAGEVSAFAPAVPIGQVLESRSAPGAPSRTVIIEPYVNFSKLDLVAVIIKQEHKTSPEVIVPSDAPKPPTASGPPPCPTTAPQVTAPSDAASSQPAASTDPSAPSGATASESLSAPTAYVPCLGSMPADAATPTSPVTPAP